MLEKNDEVLSSSEDEILQNAFKEAIDHRLFDDIKFFTTNSEILNTSEGKEKHGQNVDSTKPVSLRKNLEQKNEFFNFGVTPSFQKYVAKKLDTILEKRIEININARNVIKNKEDKTNNSGIKLLNSSVKFLTVDKEKPRKRKVETVMDDETNLLKCKEVAVDPEWISSKVETKAWTSKRKEPEFKYKKLKNGVLVEIT